MKSRKTKNLTLLLELLIEARVILNMPGGEENKIIFFSFVLHPTGGYFEIFSKGLPGAVHHALLCRTGDNLCCECTQIFYGFIRSCFKTGTYLLKFSVDSKSQCSAVQNSTGKIPVKNQ